MHGLQLKPTEVLPVQGSGGQEIQQVERIYANQAQRQGSCGLVRKRLERARHQAGLVDYRFYIRGLDLLTRPHGGENRMIEHTYTTHFWRSDERN